jgi:NhaA family Na+:H+ antiporter
VCSPSSGAGCRPLRVFLLALAILDDIVGIVFIAVLFTSGVNVGMLALAAIGIVAFGILSRQLDTRARRPVAVALVVVAVLTWAFVYASGCTRRSPASRSVSRWHSSRRCARGTHSNRG